MIAQQVDDMLHGLADGHDAGGQRVAHDVAADAAQQGMRAGAERLMAQVNGHDPWAYLRDVLARLPTQFNSGIEELLPHHRWQPQAST